jgi:hypothetical protein
MGAIGRTATVTGDQLVTIGNVSGAPFTATWTWTKVETKIRAD